jgi:hypothetical protein
MVLKEPGESDLFGEPNQHQLEYEDRGHLSQPSMPAISW